MISREQLRNKLISQQDKKRRDYSRSQRLRPLLKRRERRPNRQRLMLKERGWRLKQLRKSLRKLKHVERKMQESLSLKRLHSEKDRRLMLLLPELSKKELSMSKLKLKELDLKK